MLALTFCNHRTIGLVLLAILVSNGFCLSCYTCNSHLGGDCDYPLNKTRISKQPCPLFENHCFVVNKTINGCQEIRRGCSNEEYCPGNTRVFSTGCSVCSWDLCNSVSKIIPLNILILCPVSLAFRQNIS